MYNDKISRHVYAFSPFQCFANAHTHHIIDSVRVLHVFVMEFLFYCKNRFYLSVHFRMCGKFRRMRTFSHHFEVPKQKKNEIFLPFVDIL